MTLPRPTIAPDRIPLWAWHLNEWLNNGKQGPRPRHAPERVPLWFWQWRLYRLALAQRAGSKAWKTYLAALHATVNPLAEVAELRARIVRWAMYGITHNGQIHYTQSTARDDFLHRPKGYLPMSTDCSGWVTQDYWAAGGPDPSFLGFKYVGFTGSILAGAYKHGKVFTDLSRAKPADIIIIGPGSGWHATICIKAGADPLVGSHGGEPGPLSEHQSYDRRVPKRVCQILP
jgi:hypothetical protein